MKIKIVALIKEYLSGAFSRISVLCWQKIKQIPRLVLSYRCKAPQAKFLYLCHQTKRSGHSRGRRLYYFLYRSFYWPSMFVEYYAAVRNSVSCVRNRIGLGQHDKSMKLFAALNPLKFISIKILGEFVQLHAKINISWLYRTGFLNFSVLFYFNLLQPSLWQIFLTHWFMAQSALRRLLSDNRMQFTPSFFSTRLQNTGDQELHADNKPFTNQQPK